jgi:hypothetical protein
MDKTEFKAFRALYGSGPAPTPAEVEKVQDERRKALRVGESEYNHQRRLHTWLRRLGVLHFAPANEGKRSEEEQRRLSAVGFSAGVCDLWVMEPRQPWHGLVLELKSENGRVSGAQQYWIDQLSARGYRALVSWSFEESVRIVEDYLALPLWGMNCKTSKVAE